jgi:primosomal protein N' (replication factor Y)
MESEGASKKFAQVALEVAVGKPLDYAVPEKLRQSLRVGSRIWVPLGTRTRTGYVVSFSDEPSFQPVKEIAGKVAGDFAIPARLMEVATWASDYYCAPLGATLKCLVPASVRRAGSRFKEKAFVKRAKTIEATREACIMSRRAAPKQAAALEVLIGAGKEIPLKELCEESGCSPATIRKLVEMGLAKVEKRKVERLAMKEQIFLRSEPKRLNPEQQTVFDSICRDIDSGVHAIHLIQGVTASGKTEVYLQAIGHALKKGRSSIMLVPEISLTPQTIERFRSRFGEEVAVLHHRLSHGERHDQWHRVCQGKARITVGARSAVFSPSPNLGLIVLDEEHDASYKQSELCPTYHARDVAVYRGRNENAVVVLGSATPSLESFYRAERGEYRLGCLSKRIDDRPLPRMLVVDMRKEMEKRKGAAIFSEALLNAIEKRLERSEQAMLFLNRRGYSTALSCPTCGKVLECEDCSVALKYHKKTELLLCHVCGRSMPAVSACPFCKRGALSHHGVGTQKVERALKKVFPQVRVLRMDYDTTRQKESHFEILRDFKTGKADVLLGTQMISKGLHFENVTLVGIISADTSLHLHDFRAAERTFQLIMQVAGRAGRGEVAGEVVIQTFGPEHAAILAAKMHDYAMFYGEELRHRQELMYPPVGHLVSLTATGKQEAAVREWANRAAGELAERLAERGSVLGPAPARIVRAKKAYRYRALVKCQDVAPVTAAYREVMRELKLPRSVKIAIDVDPVAVD